MSDDAYRKLFDGNRRFVEETTSRDPEFFRRLAKGQHPEFLWIGCADSRVPANQIINLAPGDVFVHRNVANLCIHTDLNMLTVLHYAVHTLKVKHVIVCGHYGCGGVQAAMTNDDYGLVNEWLRNIKDVYRTYRHEVDPLTDPQARMRRMVELNVAEQVQHVAETAIVQNAWKVGQPLAIHGWVYAIEDGLIKDLKVDMTGPEQLGDIYRFAR